MSFNDYKRRSKSPNVEKIDKIHEAMSLVSVVLIKHPDNLELMSLFSDIRRHRTFILKIMLRFSRWLTSIKLDLMRLDRIIEAETARRIDINHGFLHCDNEKQKQVRLKVVFVELLNLKSELKLDQLVVEEVFNHSKLIKDELKSAFEEASRSLAALNLDYRIERSAP